ncbi:MAG TPA: glycosyltransferase [Solirubrobacteraceae bacterium]|jgi:glycosyltransferase involved in cell wall biosynthesis|nr:glycosyltransferase [Solirubrobacteraceae bacterium]
MMRIWVSDGDRRLQEGNGYGQVSAAVSRGLIELGHEVQFQEFPGMELALFICPPGKIRFGRQVRSAAITMHELDHLPESKSDWVDVLNRLDLVITPTTWNREVWRRAGVSTPIEVVPLGIDVESYYPVTGRVCTFLCVHENLGGDTSREDWRHTLHAYLAAFTSEDPVRLAVKTWKWKPAEFRAAYLQVLTELGVREGDAAEIEVIDDVLSAEQMRELYQRAWLFVKNANREGWSMPCTEALACGTRVAATRIEPLLSHLPEETRWFEPGDREELARVLRREYQHFHSHLRLAQRHDATTTTKLVEVALSGLCGGSQ